MGQACGDVAMGTYMAAPPTNRLPQGAPETDPGLQPFQFDENSRYDAAASASSPTSVPSWPSPTPTEGPPTPIDWDPYTTSREPTLDTHQSDMLSPSATLSSSVSDNEKRTKSPRRKHKRAAKPYRRSTRTDVPRARPSIRRPGGPILYKCQFEGEGCDEVWFPQKSKREFVHPAPERGRGSC
jgi:hypothetical protein